MVTPDWVRNRLIPADTAEGIRGAVLEDLVSFARSRAGHCRGVALVSGVLHQTTQQIYDQAGCLDHYRQCEGRPIADFGDVDVDALSAVNCFGVTDAEELRENLFYRTLLGPAKVRSILAMNAAPAGNFMGWVGCYRLLDEEPFEDDVIAEARRRADAYIHCFEVADKLDPAPIASRAIVILDVRGEVHHCCSEGRAWLSNDDFAEELRQACAVSSDGAPRSIRGAVVRFERLDGTGEPRVLAEIVPAYKWRLNPVVAMSLRKRKVAAFAASGATAGEIGMALSISPETARDHLKKIYAQLGVANRVELLECLGTLGFPRDPRSA